jgi:O-antigen/teichoic acid export membrane protein
MPCVERFDRATGPHDIFRKQMSPVQAQSGEKRPKLSGRLPSHVLTIATGEGIARICNLLLVVFVSRTFGVRAAGAYAVAQALALYQMHGIDFGLRQAGARLIARNSGHITQVVRFIQRRRLLLTLVVIALGYLYGKDGPVPHDMRPMVSLYALAITGYGFSLDWLAWGLQRFALMSGWRALVSLLSLTVAIAGVSIFHAGPTIVALAAGLAYVIAAFLLWAFWARKRLSDDARKTPAPSLADLPDWRSTAALGSALLMYQAFYSIDTMMLGGMTDSVQTGLYSAAYRLLLLVLAIYYFVMQAVYPRLAKTPENHRSIRIFQLPLLLAFAVGICVAIVMALMRAPLIHLLYGHAFAPSTALAGPLLFAIPLDFVTSVLLTALVAWDFPRRVLAATATAVGANVLLNLFLIPRYGALGAAYATPLSYLPFLLMLLWQLRSITRKQAQLTTIPADGNRVEAEVHGRASVFQEIG